MFWTKFVALCHSRGEAPNTVAANVGVKSSGTVSGWKKGAMPRDGVLTAIADYFDVPTSYFLENEKKPTVDGELTEKQRKAIVLILSLNENDLDTVALVALSLFAKDESK